MSPHTLCLAWFVAPRVGDLALAQSGGAVR